MTRRASARTRKREWVARTQLVVLTVVLVEVGLAASVLAVPWLSAGPGPDLGVIGFRLVFNPGVAFGLGGTLPGWLIAVVTAAVITGIATYAWIAAPGSPWFVRAGLAGVLAGASTNLIDRSIDGVVTDYLHTGWFPTFNLPDVFITVGAALVVLGVLRPLPSTSPPVRTAPEDR